MKKKHIEKQRLVLVKERIRIISAKQLAQANGGLDPESSVLSERYDEIAAEIVTPDPQELPRDIVEHKHVLGTKVRFSVDNVLDGLLQGRHMRYRHVFKGYRDRTPLDFFERDDELVGLLFNLSIKGTF